jgi:hypothetical protein
MGRELVWLENNTFAAWGCSECDWLLGNPGTKLSEKPSAQVKDAFNRHDWVKFPRQGRNN